MLAAFPRHLPAFGTILDDISNPSAAAIGRALGVSARTVQRWIVAESAPRVACLALFPLTRWGRSESDCAAHNAAKLATAQVPGH